MIFSNLTTLSTEDIFRVLHTSKSGLSSTTVEMLLKQHGLNQIRSQEHTWIEILARQFTSPFVYLLLAATVITFLVGETFDGLMILLFISINTVLGFSQEFHSERTMKLLKRYLASKATVVRDKKVQKIDTAFLVPGDILLLVPGDILPADLRFIDAKNLLVDESILTGESVVAEKTQKPLSSEAKDMYAAKNIGFSGTTVTGGKGMGVVFATGGKTAYGEIVQLSAETMHSGIFEKEISRISKFTLISVLITLALVVIASLLLKDKPSVVELAIFSVALAVGVIPEALPVVTTFSLSLGALHLAKKHIVVKRLSAIEDLGSIEVLCSDKTGTLTENKLTVDEVYSQYPDETLLYANLATSVLEKEDRVSADAFESALFHALPKEKKEFLKEYRLVEDVPFDPTRKRVSKIVQTDHSKMLLVQGAFEEIINLCSELPVTQKKNVLSWVAQEGHQGNRTLAVAVRHLSLKERRGVEALEKDLSLMGVISFTDPIKQTTFDAVREAKQLGIQVKILTGDSKEVSGSVAQRIQLVSSPTEVMTGNEFEKLTPEKQRRVVSVCHVFARVTPQQKYKIIQILQETYEVGFLGEGINDAPALKIAHVALVVAGASDVAKEAADIVLLKKSLKVIVDGIREGRQVFANTTKYITASLSANFGNFFAVAGASLFIPYLPMLPLQILLVNLLSDFPMIAVATDTVDRGSVRYPRRYNMREFAGIVLLLGAVSTVFDLVFFSVFYHSSPATLQTSWFIGSILTELLFIFSVRTKHFFLKGTKPSGVLVFLAAVAFLGTVFLPFTSFGQTLFRFEQPAPSTLFLIFVIVFAYFVTTEAVKLLYYALRPSERHPVLPRKIS
ncbi:MAG TPA: cation-transporting P-type ATPase [Patescibacteria group bacterium]|nr:cation-transporting P-type ATPase [Patescibacteria group bacterium]